jgi:hypothetical protein
MARDKNTFVKRQRETGKKQKAEEKRARRQKRKEIAANGGDVGNPDASNPDASNQDVGNADAGSENLPDIAPDLAGPAGP